jgi:hypothetical protein
MTGSHSNPHPSVLVLWRRYKVLEFQLIPTFNPCQILNEGRGIPSLNADQVVPDIRLEADPHLQVVPQRRGPC